MTPVTQTRLIRSNQSDIKLHPLTGSPTPTPTPTRKPRVTLAISDHLLHVTVESILRLENISIVDNDRQAILLTDDFTRHNKHVVLLCDESPTEAFRSISAFISRQVNAIASVRKPEAIPIVVQATREQLTVLPQSLLAATFETPQLRDHQVRTLALIIEKLTNASIGDRLKLSKTTVKRNVSSLLHSFNCTSRTELVSRATTIGYSTRSRQTILRSIDLTLHPRIRRPKVN